MSYYRKFRIVIGTPIWRWFIKQAYQECVNDLKKLNFTPNFKSKDFTSLLCGVGNEATADEFIKFNFARNPKSKIIIIDLGEEQIKAVKQMVKNKYQESNIKIIQTNALDLKKFIANNSVDWIETDGFLEFFSKQDLNKLLTIWNRILKKEGFITLREPASSSLGGRILDYFRKLIGKKWLGVTLHIHTRKELQKIFQNNNYRFTSDGTFVPTFTKFSLIKN